MNIAIAGMGYVGLSNAVLLSQNHHVSTVDIVSEKVDMVNRRISPIVDAYMEEYLKNHKLDLQATINAEEAYCDADYVIIATPTNYDPHRNYFDTSSVEIVIDTVKKVNPRATIVIKSTLPVGYTKLIRERKQFKNIIFAPEFLREGKALYDNLYPSRIIVGVDGTDENLVEKARIFALLLKEAALKKDIDILYTETTEAEAIKLFSNTYLAMRVAFFNEIDSYAESNGLNAKHIISGMCLDPRVGGQYNNPSFGYGGYCLPKDSRQAVSNFGDVPNDLIKAIVNSNHTRKAFVAERILEKAGYPDNKKIVIGVYRLVMKMDSDNFRESAVKGVMEILDTKGVKVLIYEPACKEQTYEGFEVEPDFDAFVRRSTVVIANRDDGNLESVKNKLYTRDIYGKN